MHDVQHCLIGDVVPYKWKGRTLVPVEYEAFRQLASAQECHAVWYSDVLIPHIIGFERAREIFGSCSTAEAFDALGVTKQEARAMILSIERDGIIPEKLLRHERFEEFRNLFAGRMLRYHFMDSLQIRLVYDFWMERPELAKKMLQFTSTHTATSRYVRSFDVLLDKLLDPASPEGYNPLKEALSYQRNGEIRSLALRLSVHRDTLCRNGKSQHTKISEIDAHLECLEEAYCRLAVLRDQVEDSEKSEKNFQKFVYMRNLEKQLLPLSKDFLSELEQVVEFSKIQEFSDNVGRVFGFLPAVNQEIKRMISQEDLDKLVEDRVETLINKL